MEVKAGAPERTRLLSPSEIELWELAKKATPGPWKKSGDGATETYIYFDEGRDSGPIIATLSVAFAKRKENAAFIAGADPLTVSALLETLEKTRRALSMYRRTVAAWRHIPDFRDHCPFCAVTVAPHGHYKGTPCPIGQLCDLDDDEGIAALLSGFMPAERECGDCHASFRSERTKQLCARCSLSGFSGDASKEERDG